MKKAISITLTILSAMLILDSINAFHALAVFMLAGIVPGTNIIIGASQMLEFFALLIGFVLARIVMHAIRSVIASQPQLTSSRRVKQQARA